MKKAKKGFTLVELMVVIVIMAVLAAAATPVFAGYVKKARAAEHLSECRAIYVAAQSCLEEAFLKAREGTVTVEDLDMERFLKDVEELSGVGGIGSGEGTPGSGGSAEPFPFTWKTEGTEPPVRRSSFMVKAQTGSLILWTGHIQKLKLWRGA